MKLFNEIKSQIKSNHESVVNQVKQMMASQMGSMSTINQVKQMMASHMGLQPATVHQTRYVENGRAMNISDVQFVLANLR